jgi:hypothetical protein
MIATANNSATDPAATRDAAIAIPFSLYGRQFGSVRARTIMTKPRWLNGANERSDCQWLTT